MKNIKAVLDKHFASIRIDANLAKRIIAFLDSFRTKNEEHIHFFGSNSFGRYKVVFGQSDRMEFILDVLDLEETDVRDDILQLFREKVHLKEEWKKYTDVMNLSCIYLIHRFHNSSVAADLKEEAMINLAMILNIKFLTSFMNAVVLYNTSEETSEKIYDSLSYKYALKKTGTWYNLLLKRSEDMIAPQSIHYPTIKSFEPDDKVLYFISDPQTRIKDLVKNLYDQMIMVKDDELRRLKSSMMVEMEDGVTVRDVSGQYETYNNYIHNVLTDKNAFVKPEVAEVVIGLMGGDIPPNILSDAIIKFYEYHNKKDKSCQRLLELILLHAFDKIQQDKEIQKKASNIAELLVYMKSLYVAARSKDDVNEMREIGDKFIKKRVKSNNKTIIASTRTGLMLYILARTFLKDKY